MTGKAQQISEIVNSTSFNEVKVGVQLSTDHRYLVNQMFKTFLHLSGQLCRNFEQGKFDGRNEFACKCSAVIVDALEKAGLYERKYWYTEYNKILNNLD